jgi:signal transduction histidine kinase
MQTEFPQQLNAINAQLLDAGRWEGELVHARRNGERLVVASRWSLQRDRRGNPVAILETNNDVTDRKRTEDALRRSEAYLVEAQRLSRTGSIGLKVPAGEFFWSDETLRILGYERSVTPTLAHLLERVYPDDVALVRETFDRASIDLKDFELRHRLLLPDGSLKYVHAAVRVVHLATGAIELMGAVSDVTAAKLAEDLVYKAQAELLHVTRVTTLGELTASIAHEVNQPLAAIVTNGEVSLRLLESDVPDLDEVRQALDAMIRDGRRASEIIRRLRALSQKSGTQRIALDIGGVVEEVIPLVQGQLANHRVLLRLDLARALPAVLVDRVQMQQVVINLMLNAVEATVAVTGSRHEVTIRSHLDDVGQVVVAVEDSGVGIDPKNVRRVFDPFFSTKANGMGMGLSICRSIIEGHGGKLWASANAGPGTTFQFSLPPCGEARP